jgi:hypothetical protein
MKSIYQAIQAASHAAKSKCIPVSSRLLPFFFCGGGGRRRAREREREEKRKEEKQKREKITSCVLL